MPEDQYLKELWSIIGKIQFWDNVSRICVDYANGIKRLVEIFKSKKKEGKKVFFIGNGGSAAIASHMTADFMKNGGINTFSLYDNAVMTCMGNDFGYEYMFSKPLEFMAKKGDLLVTISSSGNSPNIIEAIRIARQEACDIITLTGFKDTNQAKKLGDFNVYVPCSSYGMIETIHNLILQQVVDHILEQDGICI